MVASFETHSASTTLDDIINELKFTYDSSIGILDGEAIREIPSLNVLRNVSKLIANLSKDLDDVEKVDSEVLNKINNKLNITDEKDDKTQDNEENGIYNDHDISPDFEKQTNLKRSAENDLDLDDDESIPLAKRRKPAPSKVKLEEDDEEEKLSAITSQSKPSLDEKLNNQPIGENEGSLTKASDTNGDESNRVNSKDDPVPPVQQGSFTQENDTRLKNPKSEFVTSQTLPAEAIAELGLYSEDNQGLETHGKEYLKKKFGVASYPERDLQDMLPGEIPNIDFSKNKAPSNQVQFTTFQSYIESYFRQFSNEDTAFLQEKYIIPPTFEKTDYDPNVTPYLIPKLGAFYADLWSDEDTSLAAKLNSPAFQQPPIDTYKAKGSIDSLSDDKLYTEDVSCGPLSSRLLSAILSVKEAEEEEDNDKENAESNSLKKENNYDVNGDGLSNWKPIAEEDVASRLNSGEEYKVSTEVSDFHSIEERLKRELKYIGIFMNLPDSSSSDSHFDPLDKSKSKLSGKSNKRLEALENGTVSIIDSDEWVKNKEDDEVCTEIRALQKELKESSTKNRKFKKRLIPIVEEQIAYQEYCTILDDLDKQVDQAYIKRLKAKSKKKKHTDPTPQQQAVNNGLRVLLDKRKRWIENIGKLFPPAEIMKRVPNESVFQDLEQSDDEEAEGDEDVENDTDALIQK